MTTEIRAKQRPKRGRLAKMITYTFLPVSLIPVAMLGVLVYWYWQTWYYQPYAAFLQFAAVLLGAALVIAILGTILATRRFAVPLVKLHTVMEQFAEGDWEQRVLTRRKDEIGEMAEVFNQIADDYRSTYQSITLRDTGRSNGHEQALQLIAGLAVSTPNRSDLLAGALEQIARIFSCTYGAVYLLNYDQILEKRFANRMQEYRIPGFNSAILTPAPPAGRINLDAIPTLDWLVSRAIASGQSQVAESPYDTGLIEAAVPMIRRGQVAGVLDLFSYTRSSDTRLGPFSARTLSELEKIAGLIALATVELEDLPAFPGSPGVISTESPARPGDVEEELEQTLHMYQANNWVTQAETEEEALGAARRALAQVPYPTAILLAQDQDPAAPLKLIYRSDRAEISPAEGISIPLNASEVTPYFNRYTPVLAADLRSTELPIALLELAIQLGCDAAAYLPALRGGLVSAILVLGRPASSDPTRPPAPLPVSLLGPYFNLIELLVSSLEKIRTRTYTQRQLAELRALWNVSQAISLESDLNPLFEMIHHQLEAVIGELNSFAIAFYEPQTSTGQQATIRIPYMFEENRRLEIAPFPLGEGLTSIVIKTRKPLLLDEDVEEKSRALGAKILGEPAKSWLGVPMLFSGEAIGAIIVQDIQQEKRFDEEDERLLSTLASQVAVVVRNTRLLETTRRQAQQERMLNEIAAQIRRAPDISAILKTTAHELGTAIGAQRAYIRLGIEPEGEGGEMEAER